MISTEDKYYVYTLAYPASMPLACIVFYVGKGTGNRMWAHEMEARTGLCDCKRCQIIRSIWAAGEKVLYDRIFTTNDESEAFVSEQHAISTTYASSHLVNINHNPYRDGAKRPNKKRFLLMANGERIDLDEEKRKRSERKVVFYPGYKYVFKGF